MSEKLPTSPEQMPSSFDEGNTVRNCLIGLHTFCFVDISWEMDIPASNEAGESVGDWCVEIKVGRTTITGKNAHLPKALWFAYTLADAADSAEYEEREAKKKAARAKLTTEERKLLGI
jgi:hypothetical protein